MCEQREHLLEYLYDEASPAGRRDIERHLEGCDGCRSELRALRNVREDLLAWDVPNPPSVWKAFAPTPVVAWHKQVPAWALAAAASVMFILGTAGGFVAHNVVDGASPTIKEGTTYGSLTPTAAAQPAIDAKTIAALIREELAKSNQDLTGRVAPVNNTPDRATYRLDPKSEERLLARVESLINERHMAQATQLSTYLMKYSEEDVRMRRAVNVENGLRFTQLTNEIDQLKALVAQLQAKGQ
jgi:hypothetical protein